MIGTTVSRYRIASKLGGGGMGIVYEAEDPELGRRVAIKFLPEETARSPEALERFRREARAASALDHPHICVVHDLGTHDGRPFLVMERLTGQSLREAIGATPMPVERVLALGEQIADALDAAHRAGIVHRDLKPANLFVTGRGDAKILDFGLAKMTAPATAGPVTAEAPTVAGDFLTQAGTTMGTVAYMSPEQARGQAVDARSDLFSLGVVLYEMATGRRPFDGGSTAELFAATLTMDPDPPSRVNGELPARFDEIVLKALEKDPALRYQTASGLRSDLLRLRRDAGAGAPSSASAPAAEGAIWKKPPSPSTPLLGREELLEAAAGRLQEGARVLTVTGYGGTGKTRFAIELFRRLASEPAGGAAFVSLASVTAPDEVLPTIAVEIGIGEAHGRTALDTLVTVIGERDVLLVLDNLEQVLDAAAGLAELVARCPSLTVVATSRAPLKIGAESEFPLPPLALPAAEASRPEELTRCPSVELFVQRAVRVKAGFALDAGNAAAVAAICRRLDGLPLALELAAARVRVLEPAALLQRLDHALDLLTSGDRDLPLRQRTLRATISWSYSLLEPGEQALLRRLSVFHEGWTIEAMEQVGYAADERFRALDELDSLVEKGLVRVIGTGERYALLETVRAFAAEQLHATGEVEAARGAHADHFLALSAGIAGGIFGAGQLAAMARGSAEWPNLQAAILWLRQRAAAGNAEALEKALELCGQLDWFWHIRGLHLTARESLDALLALAAERPPSRGRALAWLAAGMVATTTGELERSIGEWTRGRDDGEAAGDSRAAAEGWMGIGYCCLGLGRMDEAAAPLAEAERRSVACGFDFMQAITMTLDGMRRFATGDLDGGIARVVEARAIQERIEDYEGGGVALSFLAQMTFARGDTVRALELYRDAIEALETVGDRPEIARVECELGWAALSTGDTPAARQAFRRAVLVHEEIGSPRGTGLALFGLAAAEEADGHSERAVTIAAAAQSLSARAGVVVDHPMDPGVSARIAALKASVPQASADGAANDAGPLSPAAVLELVGT